MIKRIFITDKNIAKIKPDSLIAITIAEDGAMGDPGAIELVDNDLKFYYTHFGEVEDEALRNIIPFLSTLSIGFGKVNGLPKEWDWLYTGCGNYLFIRPELKEGILEYIRANYKDTKMPEAAGLYSHWYEALENIIKK